MTLLKQQPNEKVRKQIRPVFDRMLLEPISFTHKSISAPSDIAATIVMCKVLATGPGKLIADTNENLRMAVKPGDIVYVNRLLGNKITVSPNTELFVILDEKEHLLESGKEYILQNEDTIYAVLT